jgi:uncharacterized protein YbaA (DUF1428 family)
MTCTTGFIGAVPTKNRGACVRRGEYSAAGSHDHGLSSAVECWGDDVPEGEITFFRKAVLAEPDKSVIFSRYRWSSTAA